MFCQVKLTVRLFRPQVQGELIHNCILISLKAISTKLFRGNDALLSGVCCVESSGLSDISSSGKLWGKLRRLARIWGPASRTFRWYDKKCAVFPVNGCANLFDT